MEEALTRSWAAIAAAMDALWALDSVPLMPVSVRLLASVVCVWL